MVVISTKPLEKISAAVPVSLATNGCLLSEDTLKVRLWHEVAVSRDNRWVNIFHEQLTHRTYESAGPLGDYEEMVTSLLELYNAVCTEGPHLHAT